MKKKIYSILNELCVPCHLKGRDFIEAAINIVLLNKKTSITKELYPMIAEKFETTSSRVERGIRHAISTSLEVCPNEALIKYFGKRKAAQNISNGEYIFSIAKYIEVFCDESL